MNGIPDILALICDTTHGVTAQEIVTAIANAVARALPGSLPQITLTEDSGQFAIAGMPIVARDRHAKYAVPGLVHGPADEAAQRREWVAWQRGGSRRFDKEFEEWADDTGAHFGLVAPIILGDHTVGGTVGIYWPDGPKPAEREDVQKTLDWAVSLAALALNRPGSIRRGPLIDEHTELLARVDRGDALASVMEHLCLAIERHVPEATCAVILWEPGMQGGQSVAAPHVPAPYQQAVEQAYRAHRLPVGMSLAQGHDVVTVDIATDPLWEKLRQAALDSGIHAAFLHPVALLDGRPVGGIACYFPHPYRPTSQDIARVRSFGQILQVALAIHRARSANQEWLAGLSHELRNQLGVMQLAAELLKEAVDTFPVESQSTAHLNVDTLLDHLDLQARLVNDLLDIARLNLHQMHINRDPVRLDDLVQREADAFAAAARIRGVDVHVEIAGAVWVVGDADRLRQVLVNLLQNALKYTHSGGRIDVRLHRGRETVTLEIQDNGIGFDPSLGPVLFSAFVMGANKPVHDIRTANAGLGLALVRQLVEQHGGSVSAASEGIGRGCLVTVLLPNARDLYPPPLN